MHKYLPSSLRARLFLLVLVAFIPVFVIMFQSIEGYRQRAAQAAHNEAMQVARAVSHDHQLLIEQTKLLLSTLAMLPDVQNANTVACDAYFSKLLLQYPFYNNIALTNDQGEIIASALSFEKNATAAGRPFFKLSKTSRQFTVGDYQVSIVNKKATLHFAQPVLDRLSRVQGVLVAAMDLKWLKKLVENADLPQGSTLNIVDRNGTVLARYPDEGNWVGEVVPESTVARAIKGDKGEGTIEGSGKDGIQRIYAYLPLNDLQHRDIYIAVGIPSDYAFAVVNQTSRQRMLELVSLTLLVFGLWWLTSEFFILRPLQTLMDTARKLRSGDLAARTGLACQGEFGVLARVIDEMASALERERQKLYTILDQLPGHVRVQGADMFIRFANKNFRELFGEPSGRRCYEILENRTEPCEHCLSLHTLQKEPPVSYERNFSNGRSYHVYERSFRDIDGTPLLIKISLDVTEKKQLEQEITRLDRLNLVGEMAAGIAHEIRNPLTSVRGFLQLLSGKEECRRYLDHFNLMIDELDRANGIITEYLSLARKVPAELRRCNLTKLIKELQPLIITDTSEQEMNVVFDLTDVPNLLLNKQEINQLLLNLTRNAIDAMAPGGILTISTDWAEDHVLLSVQDQGNGIPGEVLEKLGTPFVTTKETGTGLGLAVCYGIVARHQARMDVATGPTGTIFQIFFSIPAGV
nr:ATP-binding protein [Desulforamulus aeronauticus]